GPTPERPQPVIWLGPVLRKAGVGGVTLVGDGGVEHVYAERVAASATTVGDAAETLARVAALARATPGVAEVLARLPVPGVPTLHADHPGSPRAARAALARRPPGAARTRRASDRRGLMSEPALSEELREDLLDHHAEAAHVVCGAPHERLRFDAGAGDVGTRVGLGRQLLDHGFGELEVELEAVDDVAPAEGLLLVELRARQVTGVGRQLVGVAVHVEHGELRLEEAEDGVVVPFGGERDRRPAHR